MFIIIATKVHYKKVLILPIVMNKDTIYIIPNNRLVNILTIINIQDIIKWLLNFHKRPDFFKVSNKNLIKAINLIYLNKRPPFKISNESKISFGIDSLINYLKNCAFEGSIDSDFSFHLFIKYLKLESRINIVRIINTENRKMNNIKLNSDFKLTHRHDLEYDEETITQQMIEARKDIAKYIDYKILTPSNIQTFLVKDWRTLYETILLFDDHACDEDVENFTVYNNKTEYFLVALDCEMVMTDCDFQVGRVTLVDHLCNVIYDKIVKPEAEILDYKTKYSGMTESSFKNAISFKQMKEELKAYIGSTTVIVGHALWNDLIVLRIKHELLIDTSFLFLKKDGSFYKLQLLSVTLLSKSIQQSSHSSIDDAIACIELLALKVGEKLDFEDRKNNIKNMIDFNICKNIEDVNETGINVIEMGDKSMDVVLNGFNIFFYNDDNRLRFII